MKSLVFGCALLAAALSASTASAAIVTINYDVSITSQFDFITNQEVSFQPLAGTGYVRYDDSNGAGYASFSYTTTSYTPVDVNFSVAGGVPARPFPYIGETSGVILNGYSPSTSAYNGRMGSVSDSGTMYTFSQGFSLFADGTDLDGDGLSDIETINSDKILQFYINRIGSTANYFETYLDYTLEGGYQTVRNDRYAGDIFVSSVSRFDPITGANTLYIGQANGEIPEPGAIALLLAGAGIMAHRIARRRRQA